MLLSPSPVMSSNRASATDMNTAACTPSSVWRPSPATAPRREGGRRGASSRSSRTPRFHTSVNRPGNNAVKYYGERKAKGTLPVAVKPLPKAKKSSAPTGTMGHGTAPVGAEASKNKMRTKAKR